MKTSKNPIKKPNSTISDVFKAFSLFIFVALFSFFGCIELMDPSTVTQLEENESNAEEGYSTSSFIMSLLETQNIDATFSLSFTGANASSNGANANSNDGDSSLSLVDLDLSLDGRIVYADDGLYFDIDLTILGQTLSFKVGYSDNYLYLFTEDDGQTYKFDLNSYANSLVEQTEEVEETTGEDEPAEEETEGGEEIISGLEIDETGNTEVEETTDVEEVEAVESVEIGTFISQVNYSAILQLVSSKLGLEFDIDFETIKSEISAFLGIDFDDFSLNDFLTGIMTSPLTEKEDECEITISIGSRLKVLVVCDKNYNIKSIKTGDVLIAYNALNFSAYVDTMNSTDMETGKSTSLELPFEIVDDSFVDLSGLGKYVAYAQNWATGSDILSVSFDFEIENSDSSVTTFVGEVLYDGEYVAVTGVVSDIELSVIVSKTTCYVLVDNVKLKFSYSDYSSVISILDEVLEQFFDMNTKEYVENMIDEYLALAKSALNEEETSLSLSGILNTILTVIGSDALNEILPYSATEAENAYALTWLENDKTLAQVVLSSGEKILSGIVLTMDGISLELTFDWEENGVSFDSSAYTDLSKLVNLVKVLYDYVLGYQYSITISDTTIATTSSTTAVSGSVNVNLVESVATETESEEGESVTAQEAEEVTENTEAEETSEEKSLSDYTGFFSTFQLQGDLKLTTNVGETNESVHTISVYYEDDESETAATSDDGLYITYSHDSYTTNEQYFKGYIAQSGMSGIISMIFSLAGVELGEKFTEFLELTECATNFELIQSWLGIGESDVGEDASTILETLQSIDKILKIFNSISYVEDSKTGTTSLVIKLDMTSFNEDLEETDDETDGEEVEEIAAEAVEEKTNQIATISLVANTSSATDESGNITTSNQISILKIENLVLGTTTVNSTLTFEDLSVATDDEETDGEEVETGAAEETESCFDYDKTATHFDLSNIAEFLDVAVETVNTQNFNFSGTADVAIGSYEINLDLDLYATVADDGDVYVYVEIDVPAIYAVTYTLFSQTYTTTNFDNGSRISILEYYGGVLYLTRTTVTNSNGTNILEKSWTLDSSVDIMEIMAYTIGLGNLVYDIIGSLTFDINFALEETLLDFSATASGYSMTLDGESLFGSSSFDDMPISLGITGAQDYLGSDGKYYRFIDSLSTTLSISGGTISIPITLNSVSGSSYTTSGGATLFTNDYYRNAYIEHKRAFTFETNGGNKLSAQYASAGYEVTLPVPTKEADDDGTTHTEYTFAGWFTDAELTTKFAYTENEDGTFTATMPSKNTTLYAKWAETVYNYHTISYVTNDPNNTLSAISTWETNSVTLTNPQTLQLSSDNGDGTYSTKTYTFEGWFLDANCNVKFDYDETTMVAIMPTGGATLYAKWSDTYEEDTTYAVYVHDEDVLVYSKFFAENQQVVLSGYEGYLDSSKFYASFDSTTNTYSDEVELKNLVMGTESLTLYIANEYSVSYSYTYYDVANETNVSQTTQDSTYQGENLVFPYDVGDIIAYQDFTDSDGNLSYRLNYTVEGYYVDGVLVDSYSMTNEDVLVEIKIETVKVMYYKITLSQSKYQPGDLSSYAAYYWQDPVVSDPVLYVLEGDTIDLTQYVLTRTYKAITFTNVYASTSWGLSSWSNKTTAGSGFTSYTVSASDDSDGDYAITLYACWEKQ